MTIKTYLWAVALALFTVGTFGFALPFLISAASNELLIAGIILLIGYPIVALKILKKVLNSVNYKA